MLLDFFVPGLPETKGSTRAFIDRRTGRIGTKSDNRRLATWERTIAFVALGACAKACVREPTAGPFGVDLLFFLPRPDDHFVARDRTRPLKASAPCYHATKREDADKLQRAVLDAITASRRVWDDDGRVARIVAEKRWANPGDEKGVRIRIWRLDEGSPD